MATLKSKCCESEIYYPDGKTETCAKCDKPIGTMNNKHIQEEIESEVDLLVKEMAVKCCKVCGCLEGKKIWCACHRKQIKESITTIYDKGVSDGINKAVDYIIKDPDILSCDKRMILDTITKE